MKDKEQEPMVMVPMSVLRGQVTPWDMFAAAALTALLTYNDGYFTNMAEYSANYADAMMEQRKARVG